MSQLFLSSPNTWIIQHSTRFRRTINYFDQKAKLPSHIGSTMKIGRTITAFAAYQPFLRILTVYEWTHAGNPGRQIVVKAIGLSILIFSLIIFIVSDVWYCYSNSFEGFRQSALPMAVLASSPALFIAYISVGMQRHLMDTVIGQLNAIISKRNARRLQSPIWRAKPLCPKIILCFWQAVLRTISWNRDLHSSFPSASSAMRSTHLHCSLRLPWFRWRTCCSDSRSRSNGSHWSVIRKLEPIL